MAENDKGNILSAEQSAPHRNGDHGESNGGRKFVGAVMAGLFCAVVGSIAFPVGTVIGGIGGFVYVITRE